MKNSLVWAKLKIRLAYFFQRCYNYPWRKDRWTLSDSLGHCGNIFTKLWSFWLKSTTITNCQTFIWCYLLKEIVIFQTTHSEVRLEFWSERLKNSWTSSIASKLQLRILEVFQNRWHWNFSTSTIGIVDDWIDIIFRRYSDGIFEGFILEYHSRLQNSDRKN